MDLLNSYEAKHALLKGLNEQSCPYKCLHVPESYRHPGRILTELEDEPSTHRLLLDAMNKAWNPTKNILSKNVKDQDATVF